MSAGNAWMLVGSMFNNIVFEQYYSLDYYGPGVIANWQVTNWPLDFYFQFYKKFLNTTYVHNVYAWQNWFLRITEIGEQRDIGGVNDDVETKSYNYIVNLQNKI